MIRVYALLAAGHRPRRRDREPAAIGLACENAVFNGARDVRDTDHSVAGTGIQNPNALAVRLNRTCRCDRQIGPKFIVLTPYASPDTSATLIDVTPVPLLKALTPVSPDTVPEATTKDPYRQC